MASTRMETVPLAELMGRGVVPDTTPLRPIALVVDDEWIIADTIVAILNDTGFAASAAYSGERALRMAFLVPPALLLTDVSMEGMSGVELAIAVTEAFPDCRALLLSGQGTTDDLLEECRASGHEFAVLQKPVHPEDLLAELANLMRGIQ